MERIQQPPVAGVLIGEIECYDFETLCSTPPIPSILITRLISQWLFPTVRLTAAAGLLLTSAAGAIDMDRLFASFTKQFKGNPAVFADWKKLAEDGGSGAIPDKLRRVNEFFNRHIEFSDDLQIWGQSDYWATPMETLAKGKGDCEDFTIAKYFTLLKMNVPIESLRLVYVKARIGGPSSGIQQAHMVLTYYPSPDAEPLVLDNLISEIRPASRRPDLQPVFSFNSQGLYAGIAANASVGPGGVGQLSRWAELLRRSQAEGFD